MTASQLTKAAITKLTYMGFYIWRQNQLRVPGRAFIGELGLPDIIGYDLKTGVAVYCEVKTENDKLSNFQITFLTRAKKSGCKCFLALCENNDLILREYEYN